MTILQSVGRAAAGLSALACVAPLALGGAERLIAEARLGAALAGLPGVTAGAVWLPGGGALRIADLAYRGPDWTVTIGRLTLPGAGVTSLGVVSPARALTSTVTAEDLQITGKRNRYAVSHLEVDGTFLTLAEIRSLLDASSPTPASDRFAKLTAAAVNARDVTVTAAHPEAAPATRRLTLQGVTMTDVTAGRVGSVTFGPVDAIETDAHGALSTTHVGRVEAQGVDLPLAAAMLDGSRPPGAALHRPVFTSMAATDLRIAPAADESFAIGSVSTGALKALPPLLPFDEIGRLLDLPAGRRTADDRKAVSRAVGDLLTNASLDHLEMRALSFADRSAKPGDVKLDRFVLDGLSGRGFGTTETDGLAVTTRDLDLKLGRFAMSGYDSGSFIEYLTAQLASAAPTPFDAHLLRAPGQGSLTMAGLTLSAPADGGKGNAAGGGRYAFDVPVVSFAARTGLDGEPVDTSLHLHVVYPIPVDATDSGLKTLAGLGLDRLDVGADYTAHLDQASRKLSLDGMTIEAARLGRLSLTGQMGRIPTGLLTATTDASRLAALQRVTLERAHVDFVDGGLVAKFLPVVAASSKTDPVLFKAALKTQIEVMVTQQLGPGPAGAGIVAALTRFLDDPRTLSADAVPSAGLSVADLAAMDSPKALVDALHLDVSAGP